MGQSPGNLLIKEPHAPSLKNPPISLPAGAVPPPPPAFYTALMGSSVPPAISAHPTSLPDVLGLSPLSLHSQTPPGPPCPLNSLPKEEKHSARVCVAS